MPKTNKTNKNASSERVEIKKTYKIYIGGKFPRTESGRYFEIKDKDNKLLANVSRSSRKDLRDSVRAAGSAIDKWASAAQALRGQIIYRVAEMLETRKQLFIDELVELGEKPSSAKKEVETSVDRLIYYAGWADKYTQIFSSVNPVASSHFDFSTTEPMGVIVCVAPEKPGLLGFISTVIPAICGGNSVVAIASESMPLPAMSMAEVFNSSDVPGGVVNILTGNRDELVPHVAEHMAIRGVAYCADDSKNQILIHDRAAENMKRSFFYDRIDWQSKDGQSPYFILDLQEIKTTWHPIEHIASAKAGY